MRPRDYQSLALTREALTSTSLRRLSRDSPVPYDDQAEKLFSPGKLKPTYFLNKEELLKHVERPSSPAAAAGETEYLEKQ